MNLASCFFSAIPFCVDLLPGREHDTKARLAAHHPLVGFTRTLQRINFSHRPNARADRINDSGDLMARHTRILNARIAALFGQRVAVADTARLDLDAYL